MTRLEIASFLPLTSFGGRNFAVPTLKWLQGPCYDFFKARYWSENLDKWILKWECFDFASAFRVAATECWAVTNGLEEVDSIAVGEIYFIPDASRGMTPGVGHAINSVFTENGLQFIDPQNGIVWKMSEAELSSRYYSHF